MKFKQLSISQLLYMLSQANSAYGTLEMSTECSENFNKIAFILYSVNDRKSNRNSARETVAFPPHTLCCFLFRAYLERVLLWNELDGGFTWEPSERPLVSASINAFLRLQVCRLCLSIYLARWQRGTNKLKVLQSF